MVLSQKAGVMRKVPVVHVFLGLLSILWIGCDSQDPFEPAQVALLSPNVATDSLVIGEPFRLHVRAEHRGIIEGVRVVLSYTQEDPDAAYIDLTIDNVSASREMVIDTTLVIPNEAQPSELVGRPCQLQLTAFVSGGRSGISVPFPLVSTPIKAAR